nr:ATP-binding protein [Streptomyces rubellomurinus]
MGYLDFLDFLLAEELAVRDDRRFRQGLRLSKLPHHKTLDDYDFSVQPELDPRKAKDLAALSVVEAKVAGCGASTGWHPVVGEERPHGRPSPACLIPRFPDR